MATSRKKKMRTVTLKTARPTRKGRRGEEQEILSKEDWKVGALAWNKDGNIVILDPRLAAYLQQRARDDRELEIGIPSKSTKVERGAGGENEYDPFPLGTPPISLKPPNPLGLCACNFLRFHLATEGPALHAPLSRDGLDAGLIR